MWVYVQGLTIKRSAPTSVKVHWLVLIPESPSSRSFWSWKMKRSLLSEVPYFQKSTGQPAYLQTLPVCLCWNVFKNVILYLSFTHFYLIVHNSSEIHSLDWSGSTLQRVFLAIKMAGGQHDWPMMEQGQGGREIIRGGGWKIIKEKKGRIK